jgi:addiction module HigA family antidote
MPNKTTARPAPAVHPGEVLREEYLVPYAMSAYQLAKAIKVPRTRVERIAKEQTGVTSDTALRLARFFGTSSQFWMNLQSNHDLARAREHVPLDDIEPLQQTG